MLAVKRFIGWPAWGINFTHRGDVIFVSWFIYDTNGRSVLGLGHADEGRHRDL